MPEVDETLIVDCPRCKAKVAAKEQGRARRSWWEDIAGEPQGEMLVIGACPRCTVLIAGHAVQTKFEGFEGDEKDAWSDIVRIHPKPARALSSFRIPISVTKSLTEADNSLQANAPNAACVMLGRALEAVCRDMLLEPSEKKDASKNRIMLGRGIKQLREKNVIDARLFDWSEQLQAARNLAAHPDDDDISLGREDAEDLQAFVYAIVTATLVEAFRMAESSTYHERLDCADPATVHITSILAIVRWVARRVVLELPPPGDPERRPVARSRAGADVRVAHGVHPLRHGPALPVARDRRCASLDQHRQALKA